jgi:aspartyl-tRNA(Asn)/glutamyl-tRNA(Gln) amidotransferase subunit B
MKYQPTIGLEVHVELKTQSKMFCSCRNDSLERHPNVNICPICTGQPGVLPVINEEAVRKVIKTGLALNCRIFKDSKFDRKNYFYPDLPKNYQISQEYLPLCREGFLKVGGKKIRIRNIHLEEDTGRLLHSAGGSYSLVDFNRAGVPLMELATDPDLNSAKAAKDFADELRLIFRYLGVSDADMEKGQMRVEANISLGGGPKLGTKVEIKNLNSFRAVERGIEYEIERQRKILESGKKIIQETRGWSDVKEITISQREKEEVHDYRYFPEPDLPPLSFTKKFINEVRAGIPELPQARRERFKREYGIEEKAIEIFVQNKDLGEYFEKTMSEIGSRKLAKLSSNYIITDLQGLLKGASVVGENFRITPENFAEFITLIDKGVLTSKIAKALLLEMFSTGADPSHIIKEKGLAQMKDETEIKEIIREVILNNKKAVADFKRGKEAALQFLVGQVMAKTQGRANPETVSQLLLTELK